MDKKAPRKPFPKRETIPGEHAPDDDGRSDYGRDKETTSEAMKSKE